MHIYNYRESFYQWDLNQKITAGDLKVGDKVHYINTQSKSALVVEAYEYNGRVVADVPNILLQSSYPITAYRYVNAEGSESTVEEKKFPVTQRMKPDDYIYTETMVFEINAVINTAIAKAMGEYKTEINEYIDEKIAENKPVEHYPMFIHIDGYFDCVVPSGMTWGEIYALGIYEWLRNDNGDGCYNIEEYGGIDPKKYPYDGMVLDYDNQGRLGALKKFKVQFTNGTFEFPFEEGMTWEDYFASPYNKDFGYHSQSESTQPAYNDYEINPSHYDQIISDTILYTCDTEYVIRNTITIYIDGEEYEVASGMTFQELMDADEIPYDDWYALDDGNYNYITDECPVEGESYTHGSV